MAAVNISVSRRSPLLSLYLKKALAPQRRVKPGERIPDMKVLWKGFRIDPAHLAKVSAIFGLKPGSTMPLIYPLTFIFPLHMYIIAHRDFPFLFLNMLHVRDHVLMHREADIAEPMDIACAISAQRGVAKGLEFDMHSVLSSGGETVWEGISTNFFPGISGDLQSPSPMAFFKPIPDGCPAADWTMPTGNGFRFALLSGDYNGIHYFAPYARMMGFRRDFSHGQRSVAECLRRLPPMRENGRLRLDLALKGPVYYGSRVLMKYADCRGGLRFDLHIHGEDRPCIMGGLGTADDESTLLGKHMET